MSSEYVWVLQNLETGGDACFTAEHLAMHAAEGIVGNRAVAFVGGEERMMIYGRGDGTTSVMIRRFSREEAVQMDFPVPPA
jgi:hypothetical protein